MRYLDEAFAEQRLLRATPKDKRLIAMWERRTGRLRGGNGGVRQHDSGLARAIDGPDLLL